jgi:hypothetical protein
MTPLKRHARSVKRLERAARLRRAGVLRAVKRLIDAIRAVPWAGEDERSQAQVLVYRLERLRLPGAAS